MKKLQMLCLAAFTFLFANTTFAQETEATNYDQGFRLGFGLNGGLPTDNDYDLSLIHI